MIAERYRIDKAIGRGGYAFVYRATRLADGGAVALKLMHSRHAQNPEKIKRFQREASLLTRLHHPNIVETLDFGHDAAGVPFIVFELLRGHSLKFRLRKEGALSFSRTCKISIQVLRALCAAHALDVAHRDIKPGNIYLARGHDDDFVKVLDFGIAKALADDPLTTTQLTRVGQLLGTPSYMSPEQIRGGDVGLTCDLYSLGLVMAELLSGRKLIDGKNEQQVFLTHLSAQPHPLSEAVKESPLGRIIEKAIEKEPGDRFASAEQMLAAVEVVAAAERFESTSQRPPASTGPPSVLAQLKETVRTTEGPTSQLAGLLQTVRTAESVDGASGPPNLAGLQQTVRLPENVSMDAILRQHGIIVPPPRPVGPASDPSRSSPPQPLPPGSVPPPPHAPPSPSVAPPAPSAARGATSFAPPAPFAAPPTPSLAPSSASAAPPAPSFAPPPPVTTRTTPGPARWPLLVVLLLTLGAAAAALAYWLLAPPPA